MQREVLIIGECVGLRFSRGSVVGLLSVGSKVSIGRFELKNWLWAYEMGLRYCAMGVWVGL